MSPASALTALQAYVSQVNQFRATCTQARQGLTALNIKPDVLVGDQAEVGVLLPRTLTGGHLGALTGQLRRWNSILRGFTELAGADEREITVRMLSTGSEQIFLLTSIGVATVFILPVIERVLDLYKKILDIQKARKELERLGAPVEESQRVKEHEKKLVEDSIAGLAKELMARAETTVPPGRKGELENHLTISIRYMARFVDQGGDVEVTVAPPPREDYVPPADPAALTAAEVEGHKAEWTAVQERKIQDRLELARKGAALVGLPSRETEILQLPEADPAPLAEPIADGEGGQKEDKRKKK